MELFEFKVKIEAENKAQAKTILSQMFDIKKSLSVEDLSIFANIVKEKPHLIQKAKRFI